MEIFKTTQAIFDFVNQQKSLHKTVGFVPTMGALHAGHLQLVNESVRSSDITIVSIFVNPTQFTNSSDLEKYPRTIEADIKLLSSSQCDAVFLPSVEEMYHQNEAEWNYEIGEIADTLEGEFRKGHFKGVTQIVYKLFKAVPANFAFFGKKDYQQLMVIKKLVIDFNIPIKVVGCEIVRENDGLALSSRNVHLSITERNKALILYKALLMIKTNWDFDFANQLINEARKMILKENLVIDYLEIRNADNLKPIDGTETQSIVLVAAYVGKTRLIDNMMLD